MRAGKQLGNDQVFRIRRGHLALPVLFLLLSATILSAQSPRIALSSECVWTAYSWGSSGWVPSVIAKRIVETYSPEGFVLSQEVFLLSGGLYERSEYAYEGMELTKAIFWDGRGKLLRTEIYSVLPPTEGSASLRLLEIRDGENRGISRERQYFDRFGLLFRVESLDKGERVVLERRYHYDARGRLLSQFALAPDGSLAWERGIDYREEDEAGNWTWREEGISYEGAWDQPRYSVRRVLTYENNVEGQQ